MQHNETSCGCFQKILRWYTMLLTLVYLEPGFRIYKQTEINVAKSCYNGGVLSSCCLLVQGVCLRYTVCYPMQTVRWDGMHEQKEKDIQHGGMNKEAKEKYSH